LAAKRVSGNARQPFVAKMKDPAVFQAQLNSSVTKHLQVGTAVSDQAVDVSGHEIPVMVGGVTRQPGDRIRCRACRLSASVSHWAYHRSPSRAVYQRLP
jgi:hypothetical protein